MANRVFDYTEINRIYGEMNKITGDPGDPTTIAGLLKKIDDDYCNDTGHYSEEELAREIAKTKRYHDRVEKEINVQNDTNDPYVDKYVAQEKIRIWNEVVNEMDYYN